MRRRLTSEYPPENDLQLVQIQDFQEISTDKLSFSFMGRGLLLNQVSMTIRKGEFVVILGGTGSGKSILLQIFQKEQNLDSGGIMINSINLDMVSTTAWRNCLGVMEQEIYILNGTVADNILIGDKVDDPKILLDFIDNYGFDKYINQFPQGVGTMVGKEGILLSGGQKQIIGLARALWRKPQLLLLDEPTAFLDKHTEQFVLNLLSHLKSKMGILLLTHKEDLAKNADRVYKISNKQVSETIN